MTRKVYDLTEVFLASMGRFPYYGIVRVVAEIGRELRVIDPEVRFGFFSTAHEKFFEVHPEIDVDTEKVDLAVPQGVHFFASNKIRKLPLAQRLIQRINRGRWDRAKLGLEELDLEGATLISTGRPKLMTHILDVLDRDGVSYDFIALLHDMFPLHELSGGKAPRFTLKFIPDNKRVINKASKIIANSEFTKSEIEHFSNEGILPPVREIVTVPLAHECPEGTERTSISLPEEPYLLTVGATIGRKNLEVVFDAMLRLHQDNRPVPNLVLAGATRRRIWKYLDQTSYSPIRPFIIQILNPNQSDLIQLYRNAMAYVLPSRMEGWGLPAGEALWNGTPVICSTAPVFYEVCGELGLYFDPDQPQELANILHRIQTDTQYTEQIRNKISAAAPQLRSWKDVACDIRKAYAEV